MKLVVLESPNKVKHIAHYLGAGYEVVATAGHFRDLPQRELGVDVATFTPTYVVYEDKATLLSRIKTKARAADEVLLATDADREGEAISWHLAQELRLKRPMRLRCKEITAKGVKEALAAASPIDQNKVDAQQARRILDRLVGYQVSPLLRVFGPNHSAGRVQTATLHLVVARERERLAFRPEDYWTLTSRYTNELVARHVARDEKGEFVDSRFPTAASAEAVAVTARAAPHRVTSVATAPQERRPSAPFTTSTVQQAAWRALRLKPERTMELLQELFEQGQITYHRTDSVTLSDDALTMVRAFIGKDFPVGLPDKPVAYKNKSSAQAAHEAIRPTSLDAHSLEGDAGRLYELVRRQFLACQCKPAVFDRTTVLIDAGGSTWRAQGSVLKFEGFLHYAQPGAAEEPSDDDGGDALLPSVSLDELLPLDRIDVDAKQTKPPPRYTQASLTKAMEATGIGRPATYADTVATLFKRDYIAEEKEYLHPTDRGFLIDEVLGKALPELLETETTAQMEERLDGIEEGRLRWTTELRSWYGPFAAKLGGAASVFSAELAARPAVAAAAAETQPKPTGKSCPQCGKELLLRKRSKGDGEFLSCSGYPACTYAANPQARSAGKPCPACGKDLLLLPRKDRSGEYLACSAYPACRYTGNPDAKPSGRQCPRCSRELLLLKRSEGGGEYLACEGRNLKDAKGKPACEYAADPSAKTSEHRCPKCSGPMEEQQGKFGPWARCLKAACDGTIDLAPLSTETCPICDGPMLDKGAFLRCKKHPDCKGSYDKLALKRARADATSCPECGKPLLLRKGTRGPFLGCAAYPKCRHVAEPKIRAARS